MFQFHRQKTFFLPNSFWLLISDSCLHWVIWAGVEKNESSKRLMLLGLWGSSGIQHPRQEMNDLLKMQQLRKKKTSPVASDYFRSQQKHIVQRLCLSKASTWIHYPLQTSGAELITACTEAVHSTQGIFAFWSLNTSWQGPRSHHQHLPARETEAQSSSHFFWASLTQRSTKEGRTEARNPNIHSRVLRALRSTQDLALEIHRKAVPHTRSLCAPKPFSVS